MWMPLTEIETLGGVGGISVVVVVCLLFIGDTEVKVSVEKTKK